MDNKAPTREEQHSVTHQSGFRRPLRIHQQHRLLTLCAVNVRQFACSLSPVFIHSLAQASCTRCILQYLHPIPRVFQSHPCMPSARYFLNTRSSIRLSTPQVSSLLLRCTVHLFLVISAGVTSTRVFSPICASIFLSLSVFFCR